jgi:hypothetical protein
MGTGVVSRDVKWPGGDVIQLFILVIVNVENSLKQCNGSVIIPNGPVNSEVNLSMYR